MMADRSIMASSLLVTNSVVRKIITMSPNYMHPLLAVIGGIVLGLAIGRVFTTPSSSSDEDDYSTADQVKRHNQACTNNNTRVLNIDLHYDPSYAKGKVVLVTGGNRGIGRSIAEEYVRQGAKVYVTCRQGCTLTGAYSIPDIDVQDDDCGMKLVAALKVEGVKVDILVNNAGYFYEPVETIDSLNFVEEKKMIDICALGPLRVTAALFNAGLLAKCAKVAIISSQGGSIAWRFTQNPDGHDYGHHMSKAAANMAGVLLAQELQTHSIAVGLLHPGFNKTDMTAKYQSIWEIEGAVSPVTGAKRVVHEIGNINLANTGSFINCEDGKRIPW